MSRKKQSASKIVALILIASVLIVAGYALQRTVSCFLLSLVLAYLTDPFLTFLERRGVARGRGIIVLYSLVSILAVFCLVFILPFLSLHWEEFLRGLPVYLQKGKEIAINWKSRIASPAAAEEWRWLIDAVDGQLNKMFARLGAGVYAAATTVVFNLFNLILAPILVFFMLYYKRAILDGIVSWLPEERREAILELGRDVNRSIGGYIRGQLMVSVVVAVLSTIALLYLEVDYPILNGIFAGLASVLPFIGVIIATLPPLFFAYVKFQSGILLFKVVIAFSVIYFLEGYLVKPIVFKEAMNLNPLVTIVVVMAFGELLGFWGILLAIPIAAAVKIFSEHLRRGDFAGAD